MSSMRFLSILAAAAFLFFALPPHVRAAPTTTTITGGRLPHPVQLTPIDQDAFFRRVNSPPELEHEPRTSGGSYTVSSGYWAMALADGKKGPVSDEAEYFPDGGYVRGRKSGKDAWIVIDLRQRAILERYIRLDEK